jgi:hypothetical protein
MRKSPEFHDDVAMDCRISRSFRITERLVQSQGAILIGEQLRMHERQIKKRPHRLVGFLVEAPGKGSVCHGASQRIGRERAGAIAEHVPGELVEQNQERERSLRGLFESREIAPRRCLMDCQKPRPDGLVEIFVDLEPSVGPGLAPERYDFG